MLLPEILSFLLKDLLLSFPPFSFPSSFPALSPLPQRAIFHPIPLPSELPLLETCFILREVKWFLLLQRQSLSKASLTISAPVSSSSSMSYPYLLHYKQLFPKMITLTTGKGKHGWSVSGWQSQKWDLPLDTGDWEKKSILTRVRSTFRCITNNKNVYKNV